MSVLAKFKGYKNHSNYFSTVDSIPDAISTLLKSNTDGVFGLEMEIGKGYKNISVVSPPSIRLDTDKTSPARISLVSRHRDELVYLEGYLSKPSFLPLYAGLKGVLLNDLLSLELTEGESVEIQFLFKRHIADWLLSSIDRYRSYLKGNEYPSKSKLSRTIQEKILFTINTLVKFDLNKKYSDEVEEKIIGRVYKFKLGFAIKSKEPEAVIQRIKSIVSKYDSHNALRTYKRTLKGLKEEYEERLVLNGENVLSDTEIVSLLGGKVVAPQEDERLPKANNDNNTETCTNEIDIGSKQDTTKVSSSNTGSFISLLPYYPREEVFVDENIVSDLATALKRVKLITQARLVNPTVVSGIRLTTIECLIPKNKNLSHIVNKAVDIQASLGVDSLSIEQGSEPDTVKFEIPNEAPSMVSLRELLEDERFQEYADNNDLPFVVGLDPVNNPIYLSLRELPHLLVSGATGSGKSVFLNTLIISIMSAHTPEELHFYMIDPKLVELSQYEGMSHVQQVETDMAQAGKLLSKLVDEMERRYSMFKDAGVKNILVYNQKVEEKMPYIVCIIDEYADLHDTHPYVEDCICRLGQKARASGIHLVIATQRPDAKVLSGRIKTNVQNAISFHLSSNTDYKTVFGKGIGGTTLLGKGDGIMRIEKYPKEFQRFQSAIVSPNEVEEGEVYDKIRGFFGGNVVAHQEIPEPEPDIDNLAKLKSIIARTRETKVGKLRELMEIKAEVLTELMGQLVEEGWLIKHASKTKGYELIIPDEMLDEYKGDW